MITELAGPLAVLAEAELVVDATPLAVRAGARLAASRHLSVDVALHVPVVLMFAHPVLVPALAVRGEL